MKAICFFSILFFSSLNSLIAQDISKQLPGFEKAIEKVMSDFPQSFKNLRGELILEDENEARYVSKIELPGAKDCLISSPLNGEKSNSKWEALFFSSSDFMEASAVYKSLHEKLLAADLTLIKKSIVHLKGKYNLPDQNQFFTVTAYRLSPAPQGYRACKVELELVFFMDEWKVNLRIGVAGTEGE